MVMFRLARQSVRHRVAGFVASFVALALSALVVAVCGGLLESGIRSDVPTQRCGLAPILVAGVQSYRSENLVERDRVDAAVAAHVADVPGVARTEGDVSFPVAAQGLRVQGHGWSSAGLTPFTLTSGHSPTTTDEVVLDGGLAAHLHARVGTPIRVVARGRALTLRVAGTVDAPDQAPTMFVTDARARALLALPGVDDLAVFPDPGLAVATLASRLRQALGSPDIVVRTGAERGLAEFPDAAGQSRNLIPLSAAAGGLMTLVALFIVTSTLALAVQLRRREIALLRAVGATPGQLRRLVLGETLMLAVPATALALLPSEAIGLRLLSEFAGHGLVARHMVYHQSFIPTSTAAGAAVLAGVVAALIAARGAVRVRAVEALTADAAPQRWLSWPRAMFGALTLAGALALAIVTVLVFNGPIAASTAEPSAMLWTIALALLAPAVARPALAVLGRTAALLAPRTGHLAMLTVRGRGARTAAVITPVMLATGLTTSLLYLQTSQHSATEHAYAKHLRADLVVTSPDGGLPLDAAARAEHTPGVAAASPLLTSTGFFDARPGTNPDDADPIQLQGIDALAATRVTNYPVASGDLTQLTGDTIAISADQRTPTRTLGDTVTLRFGDNATQRLRIVAVVATARGYPTLFLPAALLAQHTTTGLADQLLVTTKPGADLAAVRAALHAVAPDAAVADHSAALAAFADQQQTGAWVGYLLIAGLIAYTVVSLVNTTVAVTAERRPQLRVLRLIGASRFQMIRTVTAEALICAGAGIALGIVVTLATLLPFDLALGAPGLPAGSPWIFVVTSSLAVMLTALVSRLAARLLDTRPARA